MLLFDSKPWHSYEIKYLVLISKFDNKTNVFFFIQFTVNDKSLHYFEGSNFNHRFIIMFCNWVAITLTFETKQVNPNVINLMI